MDVSNHGRSHRSTLFLRRASCLTGTVIKVPQSRRQVRVLLVSLLVLPRLMLCRPFSTMRYPPHNLG